MECKMCAIAHRSVQLYRNEKEKDYPTLCDSCVMAIWILCKSVRSTFHRTQSDSCTNSSGYPFSLASVDVDSCRAFVFLVGLSSFGFMDFVSCVWIRVARLGNLGDQWTLCGHPGLDPWQFYAPEEYIPRKLEWNAVVARIFRLSHVHALVSE